MTPFPRRHFLAAALSAAALPARADGKFRVVASFSILADLVAQVGGEAVTVTALVGPDQDLHSYEPRPSDIQAVAGAELLVVNGLGVEGWTARIAKAAGLRRAPVVASRGVVPRKGAAGTAEQGETDPHAWQSVPNVERYVANIRDALVAADPMHAVLYQANATTYLAQLAALDADIRAAYAPIPRSARRIVTTHDALGYYAATYGLDILAPQGMSTESEPSARDFANLIRQIRTQHIRALFLENVSPATLVKQLSQETSVKIGGTLYDDALSPPDGPAGSYIAMMRYNTGMITAVLR